MGFRVVLSEHAKADVLAALDWYFERSPSAASGFVGAMRRVEALIGGHPTIGRADGRQRVVGLDGFPYRCWYRVDHDRGLVVITQIIHARRGPDARLAP